MEILGFIASPSSPARGFNLSLPAHSLPPPTQPPSSTNLLICATHGIIVVVKKVAQNPTMSLASRNSYKTLAKRLFYVGICTVYMVWLQSSTRKQQ